MEITVYCLTLVANLCFIPLVTTMYLFGFGCFIKAGLVVALQQFDSLEAQWKQMEYEAAWNAIGELLPIEEDMKEFMKNKRTVFVANDMKNKCYDWELGCRLPSPEEMEVEYARVNGLPVTTIKAGTSMVLICEVPERKLFTKPNTALRV